MQTSNKGSAGESFRGLEDVEAAAIAAIWQGSAGWTVRCVPTRRTVMHVARDGTAIYGKFRVGRWRHARAEWHWLHVLPMFGLRVPVPLGRQRQGRRSLVCTRAVAGRPLDALLREAWLAGETRAFRALLEQRLAPCVRRLHARGLVFRDLYWNHLFAAALDGDEPLALVDVERVFRPRWRFRRWQVKDLAGLVASWPLPPANGLALRFLRAYLDGTGTAWKRLARKVLAKAARIRAHTPRFG